MFLTGKIDFIIIIIIIIIPYIVTTNNRNILYPTDSLFLICVAKYLI
jgi:hypothetical protein